MPDNDMNTASQWANELLEGSSRPKTLPDSLQDVNTRSRVVTAVNDSLAPFVSKYLKPDNRGQIEYFPSSFWSPVTIFRNHSC